MKLIIAAGGTGGHIYPAIAVAEQLPAADVCFVGSQDRLESALIQQNNFRFVGFSIKRGQPWTWPKAIANLLQFFKGHKPDAVLAFGGYVCFPVLVAAKLLDIPIILHEQNKIMGRMNRLFGLWADRICLSFPDTVHASAYANAVLTGCPVRGAFWRVLQIADCRLQIEKSNQNQGDEVASKNPQSPIRNLQFIHPEFPTLVVLGGSLGAQYFNQWILYLMQNPPAVSGQIVLICGQAAWAKLVPVEFVAQDHWHVQAGSLRFVVLPYVSDMAGLLATADAFVARAGASTLAEMAAMGLPGVVVPYPYAMDGHQDANAQAYAQGGGVAVLLQAGLDNDQLWKAVQTVWLDEKKRIRMALAIRGMASQSAVAEILQWIKRLA